MRIASIAGRWLARLGALGLVTLTGCCSTGGGKGSNGGKAMFEAAWTLSGETPAESGALRYAVVAGDVLAIERSVLDPATGQVRWTAADPIIGVDGSAVVLVRRGDDRLLAIERHDPRSGAMLGEATFAGPDGAPRRLMPQGGLDLARGTLVYAYLGRAQGYSIESGREAWSVAFGGTRSTPVTSGSQVALVGEDGIVVVDAADGAERWRAPLEGSDADVVASPRGGFFVPRGGRTVELDERGAEVRSVAGRFGAAHGEYLAVTVGSDIAVINGRGDEVDRVRPRAANDSVLSPGLCTDALVYFRNSDETVWWRASGGTERPVVKIEPKTGTVDGQPARAGATLTESPRCVGELLLVQDWFITAYRIPRS